MNIVEKYALELEKRENRLMRKKAITILKDFGYKKRGKNINRFLD